MVRERKNLSFEDILNLFTQYEEAQKNGDEQAVAALEIELSQIDPNLDDGNGESVLMWSIKNKKTESAKWLINHGVDLDLQACGIKTTILMMAIQNEQIEVAKLLIEAGVNLDLQAIFGQTALTSAISKGQTEIVRLLILNGSTHYGIIGNCNHYTQERVTRLFTDSWDQEILEKLVAAECYRNNDHLIIAGNVIDQESARRNILARSNISGLAAKNLMDNYQISGSFYCLSEEKRRLVYDLSVSLSVDEGDLSSTGLNEETLDWQWINDFIDKVREVKNRFAERINNLCICTRSTDFMKLPFEVQKEIYQYARRLSYQTEAETQVSEFDRNLFARNIAQFSNTELLERRIIGPRSISISQVLDQKLRENLPEVLVKVNGYINPAQEALNIYVEHSDYKMPVILLLRQKQMGIEQVEPKPEGVEVVKDRQAAVESRAAAEEEEAIELSNEFESLGLQEQDLDKGAEDKSGSNKVSSILLEGRMISNLDRVLRQGGVGVPISHGGGNVRH